MIVSIVGTSGANAIVLFTSLRAAPMYFAKCSATRGAAARAVAYRTPFITDHCRLLVADGRTVRAARDHQVDRGRWLLSPRTTSAPHGSISGALQLPLLHRSFARPSPSPRAGSLRRATRAAAPRS